jgi:hypothetical protein
VLLSQYAMPRSHGGLSRPPARPETLPAHPPTYAANAQSLEVNYVDLANTNPTIAIWVADNPKEVLPILHETAKEVRSLSACGALGRVVGLGPHAWSGLGTVHGRIGRIHGLFFGFICSRLARDGSGGAGMAAARGGCKLCRCRRPEDLSAERQQGWH